MKGVKRARPGCTELHVAGLSHAIPSDFERRFVEGTSGGGVRGADGITFLPPDTAPRFRSADPNAWIILLESIKPYISRFEYRVFAFAHWFIAGFPREWFVRYLRADNEHSRVLGIKQMTRGFDNLHSTVRVFGRHLPKDKQTHISQVGGEYGLIACPIEDTIAHETRARTEIGMRPLLCKHVIPWFELSLRGPRLCRCFAEIDIGSPTLFGLPNLDLAASRAINGAEAIFGRTLRICERRAAVRIKGDEWHTGVHLFFLDIYVTQATLIAFTEHLRSIMVGYGYSEMTVDSPRTGLRCAGAIKVERLDAKQAANTPFRYRFAAPPYTDWRWHNTTAGEWTYTGLAPNDLAQETKLSNVHTSDHRITASAFRQVAERKDTFVTTPINNDDPRFNRFIENVCTAFPDMPAKGWIINRRVISSDGMPGVWMRYRAGGKSGGFCFIKDPSGYHHKGNGTVFYINYERGTVTNMCFDQECCKKSVTRHLKKQTTTRGWLKRMKADLGASQTSVVVDDDPLNCYRYGIPEEWFEDSMPAP
jgi:hypothetical protein